MKCLNRPQEGPANRPYFAYKVFGAGSHHPGGSRRGAFTSWRKWRGLRKNGGRQPSKKSNFSRRKKEGYDCLQKGWFSCLHRAEKRPKSERQGKVKG